MYMMQLKDARIWEGRGGNPYHRGLDGMHGGKAWMLGTERVPGKVRCLDRMHGEVSLTRCRGGLDVSLTRAESAENIFISWKL